MELSESTYHELLLKLVPGMFVVLITLIAWIGNRLHKGQDDLNEKFEAHEAIHGEHREKMRERMARTETDIKHLGSEVDVIGRRIGRIEIKISER